MNVLEPLTTEVGEPVAKTIWRVPIACGSNTYAEVDLQYAYGIARVWLPIGAGYRVVFGTGDEKQSEQALAKNLAERTVKQWARERGRVPLKEDGQDA